jgi:hypothetical protein
MNSLRLFSGLAGSALLAAAGVAWWAWAHRKTPEQRERERRQRLTTIGRITDGTVLDFHHTDANSHPGAQLLIYTYDVGGVSYECSQDIGALQSRVVLPSNQVGLPASVRYDPRNPADSIVVAEEWSGLRR